MRYLFGDCELDCESYVLLRAGQRVRLRPKALALLTYLLEHHDRMISKHELIEQVWSGQFISDSTLESTLREVRLAIGDSGRSQQMITTRYRQGYQFVAEVRREVSAGANSAPVSEVPPPVSTPSPACPTAERKVVTMVCCALTPALTGYGLDILHERLLELYERIEDMVAPYEGALQYGADGYILIVFGLPVAQEDHAQRAVLALLALQRQLDGQQASSDFALALRLGVHTAEVAVGGLEGTAFPMVVGDGVGVALALASHASPGVPVCSAATAQWVCELVTLEAIDPIPVAAHATPVHAYRILGERSPYRSETIVQRYWRSRFIGRTHELATLHALLTRTAQGRGQVVGVVGEPGIGKSRLLYEFRQRLRERPFLYVAGRCPSYGRNSPYLPLVAVLRQQWGIRAGDTPEIIATTVSQRLSALHLSPPDWVPYLLRFLDVPSEPDLLDAVSPQVIRTRTVEALVQIILHSARQQPLVLEVENLHWIDPSSEAVLGALVERLPEASILLLTSYRPGYRPPWADKSYMSQISLAGLSPADSQRLLQGIVRTGQVSEAVMQVVVTRSNGNPLFLEELARTMETPGSTLDGQSVPETVQVIVTSRLDRLIPESKRLLQMASVIGNEIPVALLQAVSGLSEAEFIRRLGQLRADEFFVGPSAGEASLYRFKHILVQEAVYGSLLQQSRAAYHAQIAQAMVEGFPNTPSEVIAQHYTSAGLTEQAIAYWQRAGQQALARSALTEAMVHIRHGLEALPSVPDTDQRLRHELTLQTMQGVASIYTRGYTAPEVVRAFDRAHQLSVQVGDAYQLFTVLRGAWLSYLMRGEIATAAEVGEHLLHLAQEYNDFTLLVEAQRAMGTTRFFQGNQTDAETLLASGLALHNTQRPPALDIHYGQDTGIMLLLYSGWNLWLRGYPDQALQRIEQMLEQSQHHTLYQRSHALTFSAFGYQWARKMDIVQQRVQASIALVGQHVFPAIGAIRTIFQGRVIIQQGQQEPGITMIRRGITDYRALGAELGVPYMLALLAEAYHQSGDLEAGLRSVSEALTLVEQSGERWWEAELYRLQAELLCLPTSPDIAQIEFYLRQALDIAHRQQARSLELRAATGLARLWQRQGKRQDAIELLVPLYSWFTEGFDTADLQDAGMLLEALGQA